MTFEMSIQSQSKEIAQYLTKKIALPPSSFVDLASANKMTPEQLREAVWEESARLRKEKIEKNRLRFQNIRSNMSRQSRKLLKGNSNATSQREKQ